MPTGRSLAFGLTMRLRTSVVLLTICFAITACGGPKPRDPSAVQAVKRGGDAYREQLRLHAETELGRWISRIEHVADGQTADPYFDLLFFSGGAEWGAFGAGYAAQWAELGEEAAIPMPEFDVVGGISTGALTAAYIAGGTIERYQGLEAFFRNISPDWVQPRGFLSLLSGSNTSLVDNTAIREQVATAVSAKLVDELKQASEDNRQITVGTVNLDFGVRRYWNLGDVARTAPDPQARIVDILMASTAIPGAFPPVEIDGLLYADLNWVEGIPALRGRSLEFFEQTWRERRGDEVPPTFRLWLVFNVPIGLEPKATELSLTPLIGRYYEALTQAAFTNPIDLALLLKRITDQTQLPPVELRWIGIPEEFVPLEDAVPFDPRVTNILADLGRKSALRDDGGWRSDHPDS